MIKGVVISEDEEVDSGVVGKGTVGLAVVGLSLSFIGVATVAVGFTLKNKFTGSLFSHQKLAEHIINAPQ